MYLSCTQEVGAEEEVPSESSTHDVTAGLLVSQPGTLASLAHSTVLKLASTAAPSPGQSRIEQLMRQRFALTLAEAEVLDAKNKEMTRFAQRREQQTDKDTATVQSDKHTCLD